MDEYVYRPSKAERREGLQIAQHATVGMKFSQGVRILDPWYIIGGTSWSRMLFRLRHPVIYSKRGLRTIYRRIKHIFVDEPPMIMAREWKRKEEMLHLLPEDKK